MNKKDMIPIAILLVLLMAYPTIDRKIVRKFFPPKERPVPTASTESPDASPADLPAGSELAAASAEAPADGSPAAAPATDAAAPAAEPAAPAREKAPEQLHVLANDRVELVLSSHGAGLVRAAMLDYPAAKGSDARVTFDFSDHPAAAPVGYPGLAPLDDFQVAAPAPRSVEFRKELPSGLVLTRTLTLGDAYQLQILDRVENRSAAPILLQNHGLQGGFMQNLPGEVDKQTPLLGIDTLTGSDSVKYWAGDFQKWFPREDASIQRKFLPGDDDTSRPVDWAAIKNKYFTQILTPADGADRCQALAVRGDPVRSSFMLLFPRTSYPIARIAASVFMPDFELAPGQALELPATYYIGPKVYHALKANGPHQEDILQLGFWRVIGTWILKIMVWIQARVWPYSYGLAIILLTFLIRVVFWPLNHKSMVSTRHMQEVQPLIAALKEKYKGDPQRQQQEMMALYKEHKINPMGGCLPMLIQIPVFFALFVVLRGAIELRFSSFLWIADLSTPENLFADVLPIGLNILPIFMGVTMWIQQKLTPAGDAQQQKMMMMMPVIFTVMFYSFPSGLSLYWSTNQVLMIVQLVWMKKFHHAPLVQK